MSELIDERKALIEDLQNLSRKSRKEYFIFLAIFSLVFLLIAIFMFFIYLKFTREVQENRELITKTQARIEQTQKDATVSLDKINADIARVDEEINRELQQWLAQTEVRAKEIARVTSVELADQAYYDAQEDRAASTMEKILLGFPVYQANLSDAATSLEIVAGIAPVRRQAINAALLLADGSIEKAQIALEDIIRRYPESREADLASSGLANIGFTIASSIEWRYDPTMCASVQQHVQSALDAGLESPFLLFWSAECFRKTGKSADAQERYQAIEGLLSDTDSSAISIRALKFGALHGLGTVKLARARTDEEIEAAKDDLLAALSLRRQSASQSLLDITGTLENLVLVDLRKQDYANALTEADNNIGTNKSLSWGWAAKLIAMAQLGILSTNEEKKLVQEMHRLFKLRDFYPLELKTLLSDADWTTLVTKVLELYCPPGGDNPALCENLSSGSQAH